MVKDLDGRSVALPCYRRGVVMSPRRALRRRHACWALMQREKRVLLVILSGNLKDQSVNR